MLVAASIRNATLANIKVTMGCLYRFTTRTTDMVPPPKHYLISAHPADQPVDSWEEVLYGPIHDVCNEKIDKKGKKDKKASRCTGRRTTTMELTCLPHVLLLLTPAGLSENGSLEDIVVSTADATATYQLDSVVLRTKAGGALSHQSSKTVGLNHFEALVWPDTQKEPRTLWHFDDLPATGKRITDDYIGWVSIVRKLGHLFVWSRVGKPVKKRAVHTSHD